MRDPTLIGYLMIYFSLGIGLMVINFWLAELAKRAWGHFAYWFIAFLLLPVISHGIFIFKYTAYRRLIKKRQDERKIERERERDMVSPLRDDDDEAPKRGHSVTPFDDPDEGSTLKNKTESLFLIPDYRRDEKIEELIEWGQFPVALDLIERKLHIFRKKNDPVMIEVYEIYRRFIKKRLGIP